MSRPRFKPTVYKVEKNNYFNTKVSSNTRDEIPPVVFLRAKIRITPNDIKRTYEKEILSIKQRFDLIARNILDNCKDYDKKYIFSVDVAEKSVAYKKTTHLRYDIFLKPLTKLNLEQHKNKLKELSDKLDEKLIELFRQYNLKWF